LFITTSIEKQFTWPLNYHLTTIENFDNFTFYGTTLSNDVIKTLNWFYFLSNALCYIQMKSLVHKLISLGKAVKNMHSNIKKICRILHFIVPIMMSSKIKPIFVHESTVQFLILCLSLE